MHIALFKNVNQVLDYLLALVLSLNTNTVNNIRLKIVLKIVLGGEVIS